MLIFHIPGLLYRVLKGEAAEGDDVIGDAQEFIDAICRSHKWNGAVITTARKRTGR